MKRAVFNRAIALLLLLLGWPSSAAAADGKVEYTTEDSRAAIAEASAAYGIPASRLEAVLNCETRGQELNPNAVGDGGTSFGVAQLHKGGLLEFFYRQGYTSPLNPYEAVDFMARAFVGEWRGQGVGSWAWSCA